MRARKCSPNGAEIFLVLIGFELFVLFISGFNKLNLKHAPLIEVEGGDSWGISGQVRPRK